MKILHVIPSLSSSEGGPSRALPLVAESLSRRGVEIVTATTDDCGPGKRDPKLCEAPLRTPHEVRHHFPKQTEFYKVSLPMVRWLSDNISSFDAVHVHALFSHTSVSAANIARKAGVPYIVRPLGVLNQYGVNHRRRLLKKVSLCFREAPLMRDAAAIHFTSLDEKEQAEQLGVPFHAEVIPLGLSFPKTVDPNERTTPPVLLYLSRLDPKKNLEGLLHAWSRIPSPVKREWKLKIAGNGSPEYTKSLRKLSEQLKVADTVEWLGHIDGEEKEQAFREASLFVLPSFSENFGIAAAEALGAGLPCLLSSGVAVGREAAAHGACHLAKPDPVSLSQSLSELLGSAEKRTCLAETGRRFALQHYGLERMGRSLETLYRKVADRRPPGGPS